MIRWSFTSGPGSGVPAPCSGWLSPGELRCAGDLRVEKRRRDWLLGRWTLKNLVAETLGTNAVRPPLAALEVLTESSGAPYVRRLPEGGRLGYSVSISHSNDVSFCALLPTDGSGAIGADVERVEPRSAAFVGDFFTPGEAAAWERRPHGAPRDLFATAVWSAKEAVLKALKLGLTVDTRGVEVDVLDSAANSPEAPEGDGWRRFVVSCSPDVPGGEGRISGFWRLHGGFVLTLASLETREAASS